MGERKEGDFPSPTRDVIRSICSILTQKGEEETKADGSDQGASMDPAESTEGKGVSKRQDATATTNCPLIPPLGLKMQTRSTFVAIRRSWGIHHCCNSNSRRKHTLPM